MSRSLHVPRETTYRDLNEYVEKSGKRKGFVARFELGVTPAFFSELLRPDFYEPVVANDLAERIAALLNKPVSHVRKLYPKEAA